MTCILICIAAVWVEAAIGFPTARPAEGQVDRRRAHRAGVAAGRSEPRPAGWRMPMSCVSCGSLGQVLMRRKAYAGDLERLAGLIRKLSGDDYAQALGRELARR
jgi:hypothetical protein